MNEHEPDEAFAAWIRVLSHSLHEVKSAAPIGRPFRARIEQHSLGEVTVSFLEAEHHRVLRTPTLIAASKRRDFMLFQPRTAGGVVRCAGGAIKLRPRECILIDTKEVYEMDCPVPLSAVALTLPRHWLERWLPRPEFCPRLFQAGHEWGGALCAVISNLTPTSVSVPTLPGDELARSIATLLALAAGPAAQNPTRSVFDTLLAGLRVNLHLADLTPVKMAVRHNISVRALHYAFAQGRTSFMRELIRIRLEHSAELLGNPQLADLSILEIAGRCGFTSPSHFARRFRERFGQTPREFRASVA